MLALALRPFERSDFGRLISWVPTPEASIQWCAAFFAFPLDSGQLQRYLESTTKPGAREIFTAFLPSGEAVGHIEIGHIWPHLSCRLSRILVAPERRRAGIGSAMIARAVAHAFAAHHVARVDLGVGRDNEAAIGCYRQLGFAPVGVWPQAIVAGATVIDVAWMSLPRPASPP